MRLSDSESKNITNDEIIEENNENKEINEIKEIKTKSPYIKQLNHVIENKTKISDG